MKWMESQATALWHFGLLGQETSEIFTSAWRQLCTPTSNTEHSVSATCHRHSSLLQEQPKLRLATNSFCLSSLQDCPQWYPLFFLLMFLKARQSQELSSCRANSRSSSLIIALDLECGYMHNDFFLHLLYAWKQPDHAKVKWIALAKWEKLVNWICRGIKERQHPSSATLHMHTKLMHLIKCVPTWVQTHRRDSATFFVEVIPISSSK